MPILKPRPLNPHQLRTIDAEDMVQIKRIDLATIGVLAQACLHSEPALFEEEICELDFSQAPTGFKLPPGKYAFIDKEYVWNWEDEDAGLAIAIALEELTSRSAWDRLSPKTVSDDVFRGKILIRIAQGWILCCGAGSAIQVKQWPKRESRAIPQRRNLFPRARQNREAIR